MAMSKTKKQLTTTLDWANACAQRGWPVFHCFPVNEERICACRKGSNCDSPGKHPVLKGGFEIATTDHVQIKEWFAEDGRYNLAIRTGENSQGVLVVIDIDEGNGKPGADTLTMLEAKYGALPPTLLARTGSGGRHYVFWANSGVVIKSRPNILRTEAGLDSKRKSGIDVRANSGYIIAAPSNHVSGGQYHWTNWGADIATLPDWLLKALAEPQRPASPVTAAASSAAPDTEKELARDNPHERLSARQVVELLDNISPDEYEEWMMFGHVLKTIAGWIGGDEPAFLIWDRWCQKWSKYQECAAANQRDKWERAFSTPSQHPIGLLMKHAQANGWGPSEEFQKDGRKWRKDAATKMIADLSAPVDPDDLEPLLAILAGLPEINQQPFFDAIKKKFNINKGPLKKAVAHLQTAQLAESSEGETDLGVIVAMRVLDQHFENGKHLVYAADGFFWKYNGRFWEQLASENELGNLCTRATLELGPIRKDVDTVVRQATNILANLRAVGGDTLRLGQLPLPVVNCKNGELWIKDDFTVELRHPHNPESYLRFGLDINYDPAAVCPMFDQALLDIFQKSDDPEDMRRHVMEIYGYAIQPRRFIKIFLLWKGRGDNGKSKLAEVLTELLSRKAVAPGRVQDLGREYNRSNLKSKLVFLDDDLDHNTVLPDGILKQYSEAKYSNGRDPYGRVSEFVVSILPIMLCNDFPITKDLSQGTLKRAYVVPFRHEFMEGVDRDATLFERIIKAELAGILNRAIEGLQRLMVRQHFLEPKDCVIAKQEFLREANPLPRFIDSGWCIRTVDEQIKDHVFGLTGGKIDPEKVRHEIAVVTAKAEKAGTEGICQTTQEFYNYFLQWCRNEGNNWKPKKADVERDLSNLKYPVSDSSGQRTVYRLRALKVVDETLPRPM
jgi:putative DNA primase/helicase